MPGSLRTASRPLRTLMDSGPYSPFPLDSGIAPVSSVNSVARFRQNTGVHADALGSALQPLEQLFVGPGQEGLQPQSRDFVEEGAAPVHVQMRRHLVQQDYRIRGRFVSRQTG